MSNDEWEFGKLPMDMLRLVKSATRANRTIPDRELARLYRLFGLALWRRYLLSEHRSDSSDRATYSGAVVRNYQFADGEADATDW